MIDPNIIYFLVLFLIFLTAIWRWPANKRKQAMFSFASWIGIILIIVSLYSFRHELSNNRVVANLLPGYGYYTDLGHSINFKKAADGHFYIITKIGDVHIRFLVDTGASDITLSLQDARKLGIDLSKLTFNKIYHTANGIVTAAPIIIEKMEIGNLFMKKINASVNSTEIPYSLLGMSALSDFDIQISSNTLTLSTPHD